MSTQVSARAMLDGNEACARIAYRLSDVIAIYPITPASSMGELSDEWSANGVENLWGDVPRVVEMQSEAGAAGAIHGALMRGSLATTFTASQGLLLMLPNMYKIAGELMPCVIHVAARTIATHALSIFGDHSDVMAARSTGWAMLNSASVQEAQDMALIAHVSSLGSRVPFLHFFDGFRTSHEINGCEIVDNDVLAAMVDETHISSHRERALDPDSPVIRGTAQNPDVFFQAREACSPFYERVPGIVQENMDRFAGLTGRRYSLVEYHGAPDAERVVVVMGSARGPLKEATDALRAKGEKVGVVSIRLFRPFPVEAFIDALPATCTSVAVLDRTKEPGAVGEPLYGDVITALVEGRGDRPMPAVIGGRYGLSSKEFTPAMAAAVFAEMSSSVPKNHFTVGIVDDVSRSSLNFDPSFVTDDAVLKAVFYGLGSDGTVGANKSTVKIVGRDTDLHAQGYFVYDSKKSGSMTVSHLRFAKDPIESSYLISEADLVACHQFNLFDRTDVLKAARRGATLLINSPYELSETWAKLPATTRRAVVDKKLRVYVVNAYRLARELGLASRINTIMQACFFHLTALMDDAVALEAMKAEVAKLYRKRGDEVVEKNLEAIDKALTAMYVLDYSDLPPGDVSLLPPETSDDFLKRVTARLIAGEGDLLPVSALPVDGTFPTGTSKLEKRSIAQEIPVWDPELCIDCGHCTIVCPHAAIRMKVYDPEVLNGSAGHLKTKDFHAKDVSGVSLTIQVSPVDCTGCGICVDVCPAKSKAVQGHKALDMEPIEQHLEAEESNFERFLAIPDTDRTLLDPSTVKGSQVRVPLFEFSGACAGCGETPYVKLLSQLFGDRLVVANATGCSSIYGGNLPTTPWTTDADGRGPAWANSLFEDNAEFGLGMRLSIDHQRDVAVKLVDDLAERIGTELAAEIVDATGTDDASIKQQRGRVEEMLDRVRGLDDPSARRLTELASALVQRSVWIVGGDGWAYDIGSSGVDHALASGENVNLLVLDTEVYSNTGGQASKSTPRGAVAKFATDGKRTGKKDLGLLAASYGNVYVAQIALGANYNQTIKALLEAEAWPGPSLVIAYSTCIAHGIEMGSSMSHQKDAVRSGYWPLFRFTPGGDEHGHPFHLDSAKPNLDLDDFLLEEGRFSALERRSPDEAARLRDLMHRDVEERWRLYTQMAGQERAMTEAIRAER